MDLRTDSVFGTMSSVADFSVQVAEDRAKTYDTVLYCGRRVTEVEARILEAQFRLPDGSTLLLLNEDQPFREKLTLILIDFELRVLDRLELGGAYTPGFLTYAYPVGPDQVAFCWHDLEQLVTIRRFARWFGLRSGWLKVKDVEVQHPQAGAGADRRSHAVSTVARRRGHSIPSLVWLAWLSLRTVRFGRAKDGLAKGGRDRGPRR